MFKRVWMPVTGQSLQVRAEACNKHDSYAVATPPRAQLPVHLETKTHELFELPYRN